MADAQAAGGAARGEGPAGRLAAAPAACPGPACRTATSGRSPPTAASSSSTPGIGGKGGLRRFDLALAQAGFGLEDVRLLVCTHSHTDHYGLAAPIVEGAGCELWMHPAWEHVRLMADDPAAALEQRIEVARQSGVPAAALERYRESRSEDDDDNGIDAIVEPDRDLLPGVEVETDLGTWQVYETPGHAPSHVVLHQPERKLMISGDHLLGRTVLFFDHGHSPDPVGEFLGSLDEVEPLDVDLCLPGHGRTFRDPEAKIAEARRQVERAARQSARGARRAARRPAFEIVGEIVGAENLNTPVSAWVLQIVLSCLDHLAILGEVAAVEGTDPQRWRLGGMTTRLPLGSRAWLASLFLARCCAARDGLRRADGSPPLRGADAAAEVRAGAGGGAGAQWGRGDPEALGRGAGAARGSDRLRAAQPFLLQAALGVAGARPRRHRRAGAPTGPGPRSPMRCGRSRPCRSSAPSSSPSIKQAIKQLLNGVSAEAERRAAAGG